MDQADVQRCVVALRLEVVSVAPTGLCSTCYTEHKATVRLVEKFEGAGKSWLKFMEPELKQEDVHVPPLGVLSPGCEGAISKSFISRWN